MPKSKAKSEKTKYVFHFLRCFYKNKNTGRSFIPLGGNALYVRVVLYGNTLDVLIEFGGVGSARERVISW